LMPGCGGPEPMVRLLANRAVDAARMSVEIEGRLGEGE
jgi:predicted fused transcriptional regulator/phosphomethylpyrimidine kinase